MNKKLLKLKYLFIFYKSKFLKKKILKEKKFLKILFKKDILKKNFNRLKKSKILAKKYGVKPNDINLAYVLKQKFPSYAVFGSRNSEQLTSTPGCLNVRLNDEDIKYLGNDLLNQESKLI